MFKLQFENSRGDSIELFGRPYRLSNVEGLGEVEADIQSQRVPYQDGDMLIDVVLQPRHMSIELKIYGKDAADTEAKRRLFASVFNPKLGLGTLKYVRGDDVKVISAIAESVPSFPGGPENRRATFQKVLLFLKAPNPYWRELNPTNIKLEDFVSNFRFPFRFPVRFATRGDRRVLINDGDAPAPLVITFIGNAVNPVIRNETTGEFIKVNYTIPEGFKMEVKTDEVSVELIDSTGHRTNVFHYIDLNSTFFKLPVGESTISFLADSGRPDVYVEYQNLYVGV